MRHHYIPQFYTKQWTNDDGELIQFSRPRYEIVARWKTTAAVGWQEDLYALDLPAPLQHWIEKTFLLVADQQANDALQVLLSRTVDMSPKLRSGWSRFIMSLMSRTPSRIKKIREDYSAEFDKLWVGVEAEYDKAHANDDPPPTPEEKAKALERSRELGAGRLIQNVMDLPRVGQHLNNMLWGLLSLNEVPRTFMTSDRPVYMSKGLQHRDSYVGIAISPRMLFIAANQQEVMQRFKAMSAQELIHNVNDTIVRQASEYVYATDDSQLRFVANRLKLSRE